MRSPRLPTPAQTLECFRICQQITQMLLPINLVRLDERTDEIFILAGDEILVLINRQGETRYHDKPQL